MKKLIILLILSATGCLAQQTRVPVTADNNGFLITVTNLFDENSNALNRAVGNVQTNRDYFWRTNAAGGGFTNFFSPVAILGPSSQTGAVSIVGTITATNFSGQMGSVSNGGWNNAVTTNLQNRGNAISSPNLTYLFAEQFGSGAQAIGIGAVAVGGQALANGFTAGAFGNASIASGSATTAVGVSAVASNANSTAIGNSAMATNANSTAVGYGTTTTKDNQFRIGTISQYISIPGNAQIDGNITNVHFAGTNTFGLGSDVGFARKTITTLANGNNAGVDLTTNTLFELSGPTGAFTNNGFAGGYDGKLAVLVYQGGQSWTIANESGVDPAATNRIRTGTGADISIPANPGMVIMFYSSAAQRWLMFTPPQEAVSSFGSFSSANIGTLTLTNQLASTNISHTFVRTNFVSGQVYTNAYGGTIEVQANATLTTAAGITGVSLMALECVGNATNYSAVSTGATTLADNYTNILSAIITNNGTYTFTNRSTGAGNSSGVTSGQIIVY